MRAKTPESGRLGFVEALVTVALLVGRVALLAVVEACPLTGKRLGETLRGPSPLPVVDSVLTLGLRSERARASALPDVDDDISLLFLFVFADHEMPENTGFYFLVLTVFPVCCVDQSRSRC